MTEVFWMKRIICLLLSLITVSCIAITAAAEESEEENDMPLMSMMVFGDSITAGYGLPGYEMYDPYAAKDSFPNLISERYSINESNYKNYARSGRTSEEILKSIKDADKAELKKTELVVISAGANDIMKAMSSIIYNALLQKADYFSSHGIDLDFSSSEALEQSIFRVFMDPTKWDGLSQLEESCTDDTAKKRYQDTVLTFQDNLKSMISYIREVGSDAIICVVLPYNPAAFLSGNAITQQLQRSLEGIRECAFEVKNSREYGNRVCLIDLLTDFDGKYEEMTNITSFDIHPNLEGHKYISQAVSSSYNELASEKLAQNVENRDRSAPYSDTVVYIFFGIACAAVAAIVIDFVLLIRKKGKK